MAESSEAQNLRRIVEAIKNHNGHCPFPALAVAMNPFEVERLGWNNVAGLPIVEDDKLGTGAFRIICERDRPPEGEVVEAVATEAVHA